MGRLLDCPFRTALARLHHRILQPITLVASKDPAEGYVISSLVAMERVVDRSELLSEESTPPSSPDPKDLKAREEFEFITHDGQAGAGESAAVPDGEEDEMDFLLFAPAKDEDKNTSHVAKIRVQTPPLITEEAGFLVPNRPQSYYFTDSLSKEEKENVLHATVTGEDIMRRSRSIWPGTADPWKVLHIKDTRRQRIISANSHALFAKFADDQGPTKRKHPGKKLRVKVRTKLAASKTKQEESRKAAELKEAEEREKRTRRNREKKVKKKQREKAKKVEGGEGMEVDPASPS